MADDSPQTRPASPRRDWRRRLIGLALLVAVTAVTFAAHSRAPRPPLIPTRRLAQVTAGLSSQRLEALPGRAYVLVGDASPGETAQVIRASDGAVRPLEPNWPQGAHAQAASPDGNRWLLYVHTNRKAGLGRREVWDSRQRRSTPCLLPGDLASRSVRLRIAPQGDRVAVILDRAGGGCDLAIVRLADWNVRRVAVLATRGDKSATGYGLTDWSPDGRRLVALLPRERLLVADADGDPPRLVDVKPRMPRARWLGARWLGTRSLLVEGATDAQQVMGRVDVETGAWQTLLDPSARHAPWPFGRHLGQSAELHVHDASPDGRWFTVGARWTEHSEFGERLLGNGPWLLHAIPHAHATADRLRARLQCHEALLVFGADGRLAWQIPDEAKAIPRVVFLADGRLCWSDGKALWVADPGAPVR